MEGSRPLGKTAVHVQEARCGGGRWGGGGGRRGGAVVGSGREAERNGLRYREHSGAERGLWAVRARPGME